MKYLLSCCFSNTLNNNIRLM
ncbi:hypothetical protein [Plasmodium yoelii yoelii]|uniref:Uncharacterized protein n=1 Tax=Plasmodium yoelii yoelii TaxID=73239 RepID=Q7RSI9_PLAYO|nr:hypothetical protein [Plasmodium yoelii yoelii]